MTTAVLNGFVNANVYTSQALETNSVVHIGAARFLSALIENTSASIRYFQIFDAAALPADGAHPIFSVKLAAGTQTSIDYSGLRGIVCSTGLVWCTSSTGPTKTIGAAEMFVTIHWA